MCQPRHNGVAVCGRTLNGLVIDSRSVYKWRTYAAGVVLCQIDVVGLNLTVAMAAGSVKYNDVKWCSKSSVHL